MCIMVVVVFLATAGRYTGLFSIPWSEECSRYCMMAIVYLGLMLASRNGSHFVVEVVPLIFPKKVVDVYKRQAPSSMPPSTSGATLNPRLSTSSCGSCTACSRAIPPCTAPPAWT